MMAQSIFPKIAFIYDDRLSHDRKTVFTRTMTVLKAKLNMDIIPSTLAENEVLELIEKNEYSLIILPWYKYLAWKKIESHFGALTLQGANVAGYFADAILPFEFTKMPNFNRLILLDFYRFDQTEIEMMINALAHDKNKSGITAFLERNTQIFHTRWHGQDHANTRCIDAIMNAPLFKATQWNARMSAMRIYFTSLWTLCFRERHTLQNTDSCAEVEITEVNKRLVVRFLFENHDLTLKHTMAHLWPSDTEEKDLTVRELVKHSDFLRIQHFPETHQIEIVAFFTMDAPSIQYPSEVRGFWIEPLKNKYLTQAEQPTGKRVPIHQVHHARVSEQVHDVLEALRSIHHQLSNTPYEERVLLEHQVSHIRFLVHEIEKKVAEKKKVA
jgi:hypothetical protein